jgi:PAS domain S-box-containing protein
VPLERARSDGRFEAEQQCRRKDGSRFRGLVTLDPLSARGEPPTGFVLTIREVQGGAPSPQKASAGSGPALSVVERNEEINRAVLASLNTHIAVLDRNGIIVTVNESWTKFGRENGLRDITAISPGASYLDVCRRATGADQLEAGWACQGIQAVLEGVRDEFVLEYPCHSDGVKRWFCMTATPLRLSGGGAVIAHEDITKRVEIERRLQQSEEYYRALIEHALDIVSIIGSDGRVLYDSPAVQRVLGYDTTEIIGENVFDYIHPDDQDAVRQVLRRMIDEPGSPYRAEFRFRHKNGAWRYSESIAKNLLHNPAVGGIIVNSRDITERREAADALREKEAALNRSNEQLRALAARMLVAEEEERRRISRELHDDLNQRLAIVAVDLGKLSRQVPAMPPRQIQKDLHALQRGVATLSEDVRRTAHYLHPSILDDLGLVVALRSWCEDFSQRHSIETTFVHRHVPETLPQDVRTAIYRIVQECLRNVAKHSRSESALVLLGGSRHGLRVTVRDCGIGFDPDSARGHGALGLISIEERARLLGGAVRIRSCPGDGCRVTIQIPLQTGTS